MLLLILARTIVAIDGFLANGKRISLAGSSKKSHKGQKFGAGNNNSGPIWVRSPVGTSPVI